MLRCRLSRLGVAAGVGACTRASRAPSQRTPLRTEDLAEPPKPVTPRDTSQATFGWAGRWGGSPSSHHQKYGAQDYNFMEKLQAFGADKALRSSYNRLVIFGILGGACVLYLFYFLTTRTYVLTTNKSPFKNSMFQHFPSDYAIVENKWSGKRRVEQVTAPSEIAAEESTPSSASSTATIITRKLHTNILIHRVYLYLQPTDVIVLLDAAAELQPYRFVKGSIDMSRQSTAGWQRGDQQLPDTTTTAAVSTPRRRWWWRGHSHDGTNNTHIGDGDAAANKKNSTNLYVQSRVRLLDDYNGYQRGSKPTFEHTLQTALRTCLAKHYKACILARKASGVRPAYAEVMLQNGAVNGEGLTLADVVPDLDAFTKEVFKDVVERMGDRIILYEHSIRLFE